MKKWLYIRVGFIAIGVILASWKGPISSHATPPIEIKTLIIALIGGVLGLQFVIGIQAVNKKTDHLWQEPTWQANPFSFKQPLQFFHLAGWFFVASSLVSVILTWIEKKEYILDALMPFCFGVGIIGGVHISRIIFKDKFKAV